MLSLIVSIFALGFIIFFHEFGHFLFAKKFGVGVVEFSLGMGPRLISKVYHNTRYSLRLLPFGGSCMMIGEDLSETEEDGGAQNSEKTSGGLKEFARQKQEETGAKTAAEANASAKERACEADAERAAEAFSAEAPKAGAPAATRTDKVQKVSSEAAADYIEYDGRLYRQDESFSEKTAWQRFLIIIGGPVFNFILAFLLSLVITQQVGYDRPVVVSVEADMPAAESGIAAGDTILSINGEKITVYRDIQLYLLMNQREMSEGLPVTIKYRTEDGVIQTTTFTPAFAEDTQSYRMGLAFSSLYAPAESVGELLKYSAYNVQFCIKSTIKSLEMIFAGKVEKDDVMGPVRMVATIDSTVDAAAEYGIWVTLMSLFDLVILISASLGAMNLLPIPGLDGGQLIFIIIEMVRRKPVSKEFVARITMFCMLALFALMFFILFNDISYILR